jgi:hypothetical protein
MGQCSRLIGHSARSFRIVLPDTVDFWSAGQARNSTMATSVASITVFQVTVAY